MDGVYLPAKRIKTVLPQYPEAALAAGKDGWVIIYATLGTSGRVESSAALMGEEPFRQAALGAVNQWEYNPPR